MNWADAVALQDQNRRLHAAGRIFLDHDGGREPGEDVVQIDIVGGEFLKPVPGHADCAIAQKGSNLGQNFAHRPFPRPRLKAFPPPQFCWRSVAGLPLTPTLSPQAGSGEGFACRALPRYSAASIRFFFPATAFRASTGLRNAPV
jgi:hypothetical protein